MDASEPKAAPQSQTEKPSRIVVRSKRLPKETWARILEAYMGGATARELALKHGVAVQSIYSRMNGKGKKGRPRTLSFAVRPDTSLLPRERDRAGVFPKLF